MYATKITKSITSSCGTVRINIFTTENPKYAGMFGVTVLDLEAEEVVGVKYFPSHKAAKKFALEASA